MLFALCVRFKGFDEKKVAVQFNKPCNARDAKPFSPLDQPP